MLEAVEKERPDTIIHLGDLMSDTETLEHIYPDIPKLCVPGNCDGWTDAPAQKLVRLEGHLILMGHGHQWRVKQGPEEAVQAARKAGAEAVLFGHTHRTLCRQEEDGLWVMNPGSIRDLESYGLIFLEPGKPIRCAVSSLDDSAGA